MKLPRPTPFRLSLSNLSLLALVACGGGADEAVVGSGDSAASTPTTPVAAAPAPAPAPSPGAAPPASAGTQACGDMAQLLARINLARAQARSCGGTLVPAAPALGWSNALASAAASYSADMAGNDFVSSAHLGSDGSSVAERIARAGYAWRTIGENIAAGSPDAAGTVQQWLDSPPHCQNLMSAAFTQVGGACQANLRSTYGYYWTLDLAAPH